MLLRVSCFFFAGVFFLSSSGACSKQAPKVDNTKREEIKPLPNPAPPGGGPATGTKSASPGVK